MMKRTVAFAALSIACAATAHAGTNANARVRAFARLPDWAGIWESTVWLADESGRPPGGIAQVKAEAQLLRQPPYNDEWRAQYEAGMRDTAAFNAKEAVSKTCLRGFPGLMEGPRVFQVAALPEETLLVFESGQVRHIYTDGRPHPSADDIWPTSLGDSIGHWEGDVLVVDTIARSSSDPVSPGAWVSMLSDQAHFTERFRSLDKDTLEDRLTIEDSRALAKAWSVTLRFKRLRNMNRMLPYDCDENDRNTVTDGKMTIAPP